MTSPHPRAPLATESTDPPRDGDAGLRAAFNQAAVGIAVTALDGRILESNPRFGQILGYPADELRARSMFELTHPDDRAVTEERVRQLLAGEINEYVLEKRYVRKDGSTVWSLSTVTLLRDAAGRAERFIGVIEDITARRRVEEALAARERELSLIFDGVSDVIFFVSTEPDGRFRFRSVNRAFLAARGLAEAKVVGRYVDEVIPAPSYALVAEHYRRAIQERRTVRWEETTPYPSGLKTGVVSVTPVFGAGGVCVNLIGTVHDVSERREAEEIRTRLAAVVESSDDAIVSKTLEGVITTWNQGAERMFGYPAAEAVGRPITMLMSPDRYGEEQMILGRIRRGDRVEHYETVRRRKDGTAFDVAVTISPVRDAAGVIVGASKIARDITGRKRIEAALREETRILELLNQTGTTIAGQLDLRELVQAVTDAATQLTGARFGSFFYNTTDEHGDAYLLYTLSGAPREAFEKFGHPRATALFGPTFRGEGPIRSDDVTKDPRYGQWAPHHGQPPGHLPVRSYLAVAVKARSGEVIGGLFFGHPEVGVFSERSERLMVGMAAQAGVAIENARLYEDVRRAAHERERLLEAERVARAEAERVSLMKDEFLATLSHELRTPLNAILGWSHVLLGGSDDAEDLRQGLETIERNARAQTQLIEDLLDMSRIVSGKVRLDVQRVELAAVIDAAVDSVRPSAEAKGVRLRTILDPLAGPVSGDPNRLQQVVWNLLSNAVKFTPRGGKVDVLLERVNSHVEVTVSDSGLGITPAFLPHVFERFRQADSSSTRRFGGLGLGLAIVKQLVELHGGSVRALSEGEGHGATFVVALPLAPVRSAEETDVRAHPTTTSRSAVLDCEQFDLAGLRVLVVDDEPDACALLERVLGQCKAQVLTAASATEGLELLKSRRPDVVVSDIGMPDRDGYQFIRDVRALSAEEGGRTPAVALTAFARSEDRTRALLAGYQIHISKPIEPAELLATIASLAGRTG